jgi:hypothetical protein
LVTPIALGVGIPVILVAGLIAVIVVVVKFRKPKHSFSKDEDQTKLYENGNVALTALSPHVVAIAVEDLKDIEIREKLGGGFFGDVYRGVWQGTTSVAAKLLKDTAQYQDFVAEAETLRYFSCLHLWLTLCRGHFVTPISCNTWEYTQHQTRRCTS